MKPEFIIGIVLAVLVFSGGAFVLLRTPAPTTTNTGGTPSVEVGAPTGIDTLVSALTGKPSSGSKQGSSNSGPARRYVEIANPSGFVNVDAVTLKEFIGKKVILVDFMTYSCINCQRTFPYVTAWYNKYKDDGLVVIGIHTPEFAFEKNIDNVREAMKKYGITYPVVLDNDYGTWKAYENQYWPRKYLIDIHGNIVYDHAGEGQYTETEAKIRELLTERAAFLGVSSELGAETSIPATPTANVQSPETYFGAARNSNLGNGVSGREGVQTLTLPKTAVRNVLNLGGEWEFTPEYAEAEKGSVVQFRYSARDVYVVAMSSSPVQVEIVQDGQMISAADAGVDVVEGAVTISGSQLYKIIRNPSSGEHVLELRVKGSGVQFFTFTFG